MPKAGAPVVYFGRLSAEKGLTDLLDAIAKHPEIPLVIAGDGPQRSELEQICQERGLNHVRFAGHLSGNELGGLIAESAFTVLPSLAYETLGKSILESYAWGRAVIATDLGSRREFVNHGSTGLLFAPGNAEALANAIAYLYANPGLAWKMGRTGQQRVMELHSPEEHLKAIMQLYGSLAPAIHPRVISPFRGKKNAGPGDPKPSPSLRVAFIGGRGVVSKYSGIEAYYEEVGRRLAERGHDVTIYCRPHFTPAIPQYHGMILNARAGKPLPVYGDGQNVRDWLYVGDHCDAIRAVLANGIPGETYNVGGWNEKKNLEIVESVCSLLDEFSPNDPVVPHRQLISFVKDRPGHDRRYAIDARKIERELHWRPRETFETGIRKTIRWYLDHEDWVREVTSGDYRKWIATQYSN